MTAGYADNGSGQKAQASIRLGQGNGTFGGKTTVATLSGTFSQNYAVTVGDLNGDNVLDLISAGNGLTGGFQGQASVLLGCGDGTFGPKTIFATETGPFGGRSLGVSTGDLNGDGILDIVTAGYDSNIAQGMASIRFGNSRSGVNPLLPFSLKTQIDAKGALSLMSQKLNLLSSQRATIGAYQSRISYAISTLNSTTENYAAAASRIADADIGQESADLVRRQILQKATTAVLSQANQQPALVLQLL